ncbi:sterile alpha motif domain-containing protein 5 [Elysia marginata]|uniref:Sterile alpha motif domain-containing protein 5 n=1 Tax=Elysia marginata TaxID=1093978 RepID=A0AAV4ELU0_9GAST|nr:sterile alpha motif domain-containing protein 5 [Elysia marginata]
MATGSNSIVEDWLRSVGLVQYTQAFLDNGYDDLEVCKQIGEDDLAAIGVAGGEHRDQLLGAVKVLREEGGAAVYFTLEECCDTGQSEDDDEDDRTGQGLGDRAGSRRRSGGVGGAKRLTDNSEDSRRPSGTTNVPGGTNLASSGRPGDARSPRSAKPAPAAGGARKLSSGNSATAPSTPSGRGASGGASLMRMDAYELGKSALVKFPSVQLKLILRDKLVENNIDLSGPPYTNSVSTCNS